MKALILALCLLATPCYANGVEVIRRDNGGVVFDYIAKYVGWYNQQRDVRVEGECDSSCSLVLVFIPIDHICATANAEFGFHSAAMIVVGHPEIKPRYDSIMTALMWQIYNNVERVHRVLVKHHFAKPQNHPDLVMIDAQEFVAPCPPIKEEATAEPAK
jgi:hypothetical protein